MHERTPDQKNNYFRELTRNLQREGFTVSAEEKDLLPVELAGRRLCQVTSSGGVQHWWEDITDERMSKALERVTDIVCITDEYMSQPDTVPFLKVGSRADHYRLLAEFNGTVLAGYQTQYGAQFITWQRRLDRTSLDDGHYYGPACGVDRYTTARQDFAARSGLIPRSILASGQKLCETVFYRGYYFFLCEGKMYLIRAHYMQDDSYSAIEVDEEITAPFIAIVEKLLKA